MPISDSSLAAASNTLIRLQLPVSTVRPPLQHIIACSSSCIGPRKVFFIRPHDHATITITPAGISMGKKGGNSWLTVVKRAFRSPTKDSQKKSSRRREEFEVPEEEEEKKREKKRWLFRKASTNNASAYCVPQTQSEAKVKTTSPAKSSTPELLPPQQRQAFAVAVATAHQAAVEIIRLTRSSNPTSVKQHYAATIIQTAFRGYVARRALVALKGIVKLQALIRGQNVRKQAKMTLKCMQALLRVQARVRDQQPRLSNDGGRKSMFAECNNLWESRYLGEIRERKSMSTKNRSSIAEEYYCVPRTLEDLEAAIQATKEAAALKREKSLASAFSHRQTWDDYDISGYEKEEVEERTNWLDKWMATKQWDTYSRGSTDKRDSSIKTVEMDTLKQYSSPYSLKNQYQRPSTPHSAASPRHRSLYNSSMLQQQPTAVILTPSPSKNKPGQHLRSCSPRRSTKEEKSYSYSTANTPSSSLRSLQRLNSSNLCRYSVSTNEGRSGINVVNDVAALMLPSYMAATESAKARARSQSAPRQRSSTPEREQRGGGSAKKRLSFPVPPDEPTYFTNAPYGYTTYTTAGINHQNLRSPSFKSLQAGYVGMEQQSNQSCYTDSIGGEISPCSTTDMRRWLR